MKSGTSRPEIAERLSLSEATVRTHLQHIYRKLDMHSARELMISDRGHLASMRSSRATPGCANRRCSA